MSENAQTILVLTQGFVFVGELDESEAGFFVLRRAKNIRVWGTSEGLGELAVKGPTEKTVADPCGTVRAPLHAVVFTLPCIGRAL